MRDDLHVCTVTLYCDYIAACCDCAMAHSLLKEAGDCVMYPCRSSKVNLFFVNHCNDTVY